MPPDSTTRKPGSRKSLILLMGLLGVVIIVYLLLPTSWFEIPKETSKGPPTAPRGATHAPPPPLDALREAAQKTPLSFEARSRYGMALAATHSVEALEEFLAAARLAPDSPIVHHNLGVYYLNHAQPDKADAAFQRELELTPGDARVHYYRGITMQARRHYPEAAVQFQMTAQLAPNFPDTYLALATLFTEKHPPEEIKGYVETYVRLGGVNKGLAYHALSRAYRTKQNYNEAIRYAEMATKEAPNVVLFRRNLGQIYSYTRRFDDADKTLRQVAEMAHDPSPVYIEIGVNAQKAGRYPVAIEALQKALQLSPKTGNIHQYLSYTYRLAGDKAAALQEMQAFHAWERGNRLKSASPGK